MRETLQKSASPYSPCDDAFMKQMSLGTGFEKQSKRTRKREFLDEMELVVPWRDLVALIEPHSPPKATGRPAFAIETMLRIHLL